MLKKIERKIPYSSDYNTCTYVEAKKECKNKSFPKISEIDVDYSNYDNILLFFLKFGGILVLDLLRLMLLT